MHMTSRVRTARRLTCALLLTGATLLPLAAWSQTLPGAPANAGQIATGRRSGGAAKPVVTPPPALPGARSSTGAAPATRLASDMSPNEALFDAINRGDIGAVRDAFSRGAELNAQNILGLTPTELAVDLGRNDIALLLLSMRGEEGAPKRGAQQAAAKAPAAAPQPTVVKAAARPATPAPVAVPSKVATSDGGTPNPSAGFLGFGAPQR
jgi:hypothetical protein